VLSERIKRRLATGLAVVAVLVVVALLLGLAGDRGAEFTAVSLIGAGVGLGELVSRYRDRPWKALRTWPAAGYVLLNACASAGALGLILTFGWTFGAEGDALVATRVLVAGFGAMALFRTSLFTVRAGDQDVGIGPSSLLSIILTACDRGVDRERAKDRAVDVGEIMKDVSFARARGPLPTVALALMQNLDAPDQAALGLQVEKLANDAEMSDSAKSLLLGLAISNAVGPYVLGHAKQALGPEILRAADDEDEPPAVADAVSTSLIERIRRRLEEGESGVGAEDGGPAIPGTDAQERTDAPGLPQTPQTPE
jgi:hypothetical protein